MKKLLSKVTIGSILFFLVILYRDLISSVEEHMDISSLYYKNSIGDGFRTLVLYAYVGLFFVFITFLLQDTRLSPTLILRSIPISFLLFFMVFSGEFSALTNHYPIFSIFSFFGNLVTGAAAIVVLLLLYWDSVSIRGDKFWTSWLLIGVSMPIFSYLISYLLFVIIQIILIDVDIRSLFPSFGDANGVGFFSMFALVVMYIEIRIMSLVRGNPKKNILGEYDIVQLIYSNTLNIITETIALFCTSLAAIWSVSVFIFDQPIDQSKVPLAFVHFTFLLTIPFSLLMARGLTHDDNVISNSI